jgi:hypothetical protein
MTLRSLFRAQESLPSWGRVRRSACLTPASECSTTSRRPPAAVTTVAWTGRTAWPVGAGRSSRASMHAAARRWSGLTPVSAFTRGSGDLASACKFVVCIAVQPAAASASCSALRSAHIVGWHCPARNNGSCWYRIPAGEPASAAFCTCAGAAGCCWWALCVSKICLRCAVAEVLEVAELLYMYIYIHIAVPGVGCWHIGVVSIEISTAVPNTTGWVTAASTTRHCYRNFFRPAWCRRLRQIRHESQMRILVTSRAGTPICHYFDALPEIKLVAPYFSLDRSA